MRTTCPKCGSSVYEDVNKSRAGVAVCKQDGVSPGSGTPKGHLT